MANLSSAVLCLLLIFATSASSAATQPQSFIQCFLIYSKHKAEDATNVYIPNTDSYNATLLSSVHNIRFLSSGDKKPSYIAVPGDASDVQAAVSCARRFGLRVRVRSGGHDYEGLSYVSAGDPFVLLDLTNLRSVAVDASRNIAWVGAGATVGEVYYNIGVKSATLAFPAGICTTVGVGGHFSGGGIGTLLRKYGTSADNIVDAQIVDANGKLLNRASMGEDLFWAIRGGGAANFGVLVSYKLRLVPVPATVTVFAVTKNPDLDSDVLRARFGFDVGSDPSLAVSDFGGLVHGCPPAAFIRPSTADDVSLAVRIASNGLVTVAARGNGHSISGQAMADAGGLVLDMRALCAHEPMRLVRLDDSGSAAVDVPGGALWEEVLEWGVRCHGMSPPSWTDYLRLTVGGTLSVGGISGQAFRCGPQLSNVAELEVVCGDGERHVCSPSTHPDLFFAVLGGLGQFGIITRARIPLVPAPRMVKWIRLVYGGFEDYAADAESLVCRSSEDSEAAAPFDYVEGFVFVNDPADPVNGWSSVPLSPGSSIDPGRVPAGSGAVLYCLELALHYDHEDADDVDKRAEEMTRPLRYIRGLEFAADVSYVEFLSRVGRAEEEARANGSWSRPHPWLNILVSSQNISDFDRDVFKSVLRRGIGGPMLVYPLLKSKWDCRTSMVVPDSEVFYLVALLRVISAEDDDSAAAAAEAAVAQNREIVECCRRNGYDFKLYIPHYETDEEWAEHFGRDWTRFVERKRRYDPTAVLAPGQRIFSPRRPV